MGPTGTSITVGVSRRLNARRSAARSSSGLRARWAAVLRRGHPGTGALGGLEAEIIFTRSIGHAVHALGLRGQGLSQRRVASEPAACETFSRPANLRCRPRVVSSAHLIDLLIYLLGIPNGIGVDRRCCVGDGNASCSTSSSQSALEHGQDGIESLLGPIEGS